MYKIANFLVSILALIVIISISIAITVLTRPIYYFDIDNLNIAETSGISKEECKLNYDVLVEYNTLGGSKDLIFPTFTMSEEGRIHFEEVKNIFVTAQIISIAGIVAFIGFIIWLVKRKRSNIHKYIAWLSYTKIALGVVIAVVLIAILLDWQSAFYAMHKIFFRNDYWLFNATTDPVIKILPEEFFMHCGIMIIFLTILQIFILDIVYKIFSKKVCRRRKNARS